MGTFDRAFDRLERGWRALLAWRTRHSVGFLVVALGVSFGAPAAALSGWEWAHVRGHPVERAEVVGWVLTDDSAKCGKYAWGDVYEVYWRSADPPEGMPALFTSTEDCGEPRRGEVADVVRTVDDDGIVHVWTAPATSFGVVVAITTFLAIVGSAIGLVVGLIQLAWRRLRRSSGSEAPPTTEG